MLPPSCPEYMPLRFVRGLGVSFTAPATATAADDNNNEDDDNDDE
jgi:hypothetical protein